MAKFFSYTRTKKEAKKDDQGQIIYKLDEQGQPIKDQPEMIEKNFVDWFNLDYVLRTFTVSDDHVVVLLDDGHEESQSVTALKNKFKPATPQNLTEQRQRQYVQSEISVKGADIQRLHEALAKV
jgi:hypothetical protein